MRNTLKQSRKFVQSQQRKQSADIAGAYIILLSDFKKLSGIVQMLTWTVNKWKTLG